MTVELHTLSWTNAPEELVACQRRVMSHFDLDVKYTIATIWHADWMDMIMKGTGSDVVGFIDSDCIPLSREAVDDAVNYVIERDTFLGIAQSSNHKFPKSHIYAGPAFFFISKNCYERLGRPSFGTTDRSDVGEEVSYVAEERDVEYRSIYPTHYERVPEEGVWKLGNYGFFGIGTVYQGLAYHLFQGRLSKNLDLFQRRCDETIKGTFSTDGMFAANSIHDLG
jgi:hypothetical protein